MGKNHLEHAPLVVVHRIDHGSRIFRYRYYALIRIVQDNRLSLSGSFVNAEETVLLDGVGVGVEYFGQSRQILYLRYFLNVHPEEYSPDPFPRRKVSPKPRNEI